MNYCPKCGSTVTLKTPLDDTRERHVCSGCETIHYENPRNVVGTIPVWQDKVLLCKRAIQPRLGYWTLPAGFLEVGESTEDGAKTGGLFHEFCVMHSVRLIRGPSFWLHQPSSCWAFAVTWPEPSSPAFLVETLDCGFLASSAFQAMDVSWAI